MTVPLSWKACVKSNPLLSVVFPAVFKPTLRFPLGRRGTFLNCLLGKASSFSAALLPGGGGGGVGVQHNDKCQENFKVFPTFSLSFPSSFFLLPLFQKPRTSCSSLLTHVVRCCLLFLLRIMMKNADFSPLRFFLSHFSSRLLHTLRAVVITATRSQVTSC